MSSTKRTLYLISGISTVLMFVFLGLFVNTRKEVMLIFGIITLNVSYHLITRLLIGSICEGLFENGINSSSDWFRVTDFEERFYSSMGIKYLKRNLPKLERTDFSLRTQSFQDIIDIGCEIEIEHQIGIAVSMLGMLLSIPFGYAWIFAIFSAAAVVFDLVILAIQRFNRPRLERVQMMRRARFFEKMERREKLEAAEASADMKDIENAKEENQ